MSRIVSTTEFAATSDGLSQLQRRWEPPDPVAALLLVHGIGEHSGRYMHVGDALAARGVDVLAFDNRGFGQSGGRRAHVDRFRHYVDDVQALLLGRRRLGVPVVLMGHSLGGLIVATYLVDSRPQPDLAVLSAPALAADVPRWQTTVAPLLGRAAPTVHIPSKIEPELLSRDPEVQRAYLEDPLVIGGATAGLGREIFRTMESTTAKLDRLSCPTYVLHGDADRLVPLRASDPLDGHGLVTRRIWSGLRHECLNEPEQDDVVEELIVWIEGQLASGSSST